MRLSSSGPRPKIQVLVFGHRDGRSWLGMLEASAYASKLFSEGAVIIPARKASSFLEPSR